MAKADQIKNLIKMHFDGQNERFITIALQIAAHEAKLGHTKLADDIKKIIDSAKTQKPKLKPLNRDLQELVIEVEPIERISDLIVSDNMSERIQRIVTEYVKLNTLRKHNLTNRRKLLLTGPPGTGKTMTASIISNELNLPLNIVLMDKMVTKFMGETSAKLRQVFEIISENKAVYLFDEFDAIGTNRNAENDVGEMRRVLNSFLQFIEQDKSESLIVAATNNLKLLDQALFRRFDDVIHYHLPNDDEVLLLLNNKLGSYKDDIQLETIIKKCHGLSHAEISLACMDTIKSCILSDKKKITKTMLVKTIEERKQAYIK
ncbi:AAA family ATPase [Saccharicrinis fermentans]|uniref:ATP-dependent zinc metalloprotease FtsH n=1 Tax=Saccharicrinis fermentans DSM 9555 = JCM 21142 TaxID=869213 RepID=W7Y398_9BACT|nr:ATP-binding protein [Saccharicrinis fermentans]GAF05325.1 ATP-dependent zinc metalloprotease FtsH [Saccharicrinis fermentans DSM 9555 = JCM 21142]